jgi:hypothetical protein
MSERLSRQELYDLVWSEPVMNLAIRFGISDVALKKTCARASIPTPDRGYWAKKQAGKPTIQVSIPRRPPGMSDEIFLGGAGNNNYYSYGSRTKEELLGPLPPPPEFIESLEHVRESIKKAVGKISVPREVRIWHPAIDRLLKDDDRRREAQRSDSYSWDKPLFDSPLERRRLRLLNGLFFGVARMNGKPRINGREGRDIYLSVYTQGVFIDLDRSKESHRRGQQQPANDSSLCLSIRRDYRPESVMKTWLDNNAGKLETKLTEIAVEVILAAETEYREGAIRQHEWRIKRKAQLEEEQRQRKIEAEREERDREARQKQARVDRLMKDAAALQRASEIRKYVDTVRAAFSNDGPTRAEDFETWSTWALAQADRIDPTVDWKFLASMLDDPE